MHDKYLNKKSPQTHKLLFKKKGKILEKFHNNKHRKSIDAEQRKKNNL